MFELNSPTYTEMLLAILSLIIVIFITFTLKKLSGSKLKRPNGKKGGVISFHAATSLCIVTLVAILTKDWFITGLTVVLAYLIIKSRLADNHHWTWQVVFGSIVGAAVPASIFYIKENGFNFTIKSKKSDNNLNDLLDSHDNPLDNRNEAIKEAPDLALEEID